MMDTEKNRQWEEDVKVQLTPLRDGLQNQLDKIRELRMDIGLKSREALREYRMKLGELSFTVGAAIVPVIIVSNNKVHYVKYAILGIALYLLSGLLLFWRGRTMLYQDATDAPQVGLDQEVVLEPVIHAYNKVIFDPSNSAYKDELMATQLHMLECSAKAQNEPIKAHIDFSIEVGLAGFVFATFFVARTVWPFSDRTFWTVFWIFTVVIPIIMAFLYVQTRGTRSRVKSKKDKITNNREAYQKWHNKHVLGDK